MTLRFFADHCVALSIAQALGDAGHKVLRLADHMPADSSDSAVISKAQELDCILVSLNSDFAGIVAYPPADYMGIISLQVGDHPEGIPQHVTRLRGYLLAHPDMDHYRGKLFSVEVHRIRVRE